MRWCYIRPFYNVSAYSLLVGFGGFSDNTIKGLTCLLSVEQVIVIVIYIYDVLYCVNHYESKLKLKGKHAWYFMWLSVMTWQAKMHKSEEIQTYAYIGLIMLVCLYIAEYIELSKLTNVRWIYHKAHVKGRDGGLEGGWIVLSKINRVGKPKQMWN
jgi:hypothetical protein